MDTCPECLENDVPAPGRKCIPCCEMLVARWVAERDAPTVKAVSEVKTCPGIYIQKNLIRCGKRANQEGLCKRHRQMVSGGQATAA